MHLLRVTTNGFGSAVIAKVGAGMLPQNVRGVANRGLTHQEPTLGAAWSPGSFLCARVEARLNLPVQRSKLFAHINSSLWEVCMPHYEFFCRDCKKFFDKILSLVDYEEGEVQCPHCDSTNIEQRWSVFSAITSKKSA